MAEPLLAFKAGRAVRREGTNFVDPIPTKGAVLLTNEDGLLHLQWKNRTTNEVEEVSTVHLCGPIISFFFLGSHIVPRGRVFPQGDAVCLG